LHNREPSGPFFEIMNKNALVKKVIAHLTAELESYGKAARAAHAEATHEQSKAENKYDTRGLEASYLARGQSKQMAEVAQAIDEFQKMAVRSFGPAAPIELSAVVEMDGNGERSFYLIGPRAGGTEISHDKKTIMVLTPQSPMGEKLMGRKQGDQVEMQFGAMSERYRVISVE
jgi:transcription elongation GreA/GreB family factor